jgi:glycosyltransferase involved in cell wall biosynthesis
VRESIIIANDDSLSYRFIAFEIGKVLGRNYDVCVLDCGYRGGWHTYPFSLVSAIYRALPDHVRYLRKEIEPVYTIFIFDLKRHIRLETALHKRDWEYTAIFPIESWPLLWADDAREIDHRFVISQFGYKVCKDAGLNATFLPLGLDTKYWAPGDNKDGIKEKCGQFWINVQAIKSGEDPADITNRIAQSKIVLTVADNQERKNLPACFEIVSKLGEDVMLVIVAPSKAHKGVAHEGWELHELAKDWNLQNRFVWVGGLSKDLLRDHYRMADVFLLPSQAEGYGLILREAAACGLPWVATDCTAISEAPGGIKVPAKGSPTIFPLGNQRRYWIDTDAAAEAIDGIFKHPEMVGDFGRHPTWEDCVEVLIGKEV